jgi:hypothetical protein
MRELPVEGSFGRRRRSPEEDDKLTKGGEAKSVFKFYYHSP